MTFSNLFISFNELKNKYTINSNNLHYPFKTYIFSNYSIFIIGNPIIDQKINFEHTLSIVKKIIEFNFFKTNVLNEINGEFVIILENHNTNEIHIINDRFSSIPLYYTEINGKFFVSSNYIDLVKKTELKLNLNKLSLFEFIYFKRLHSEDTYDKNIFFLKAGSILSFQKKIKLTNYIRNEILDNNYSLDENAKLLSFYVEQAINRKINSKYEEYGLFLSGGLDTRFITASLNNLDKNKEILYYTLGWDKKGEFEITSKICEIIKSQNIFMEIKENYYELYNDEKLYISNGMYNMYQNIFLNLTKFLNDKTKIIFHGHGLDYMFQGMYVPSLNYQVLGKKTLIKRLVKLDYNNIKKFYINNVSYKVKNKNFEFIIKNKYYNFFINELENKIDRLIEESKAFTDDPYKSWEYIINHNLSRHYSYTDVLGIGTNLEQRKIANDNDLFNFYMSLPPEHRINGKIIKKSLIKQNTELANLISANTRFRISAPSYQITLNNYKNKILYFFTQNENYLFPLGKRRTWPNEYEILKNSKYFIKKTKEISRSEVLREYVDFIDYDNLSKQIEEFNNTNNNNELAQFIFLLFTLENLFKEF